MRIWNKQAPLGHTRPAPAQFQGVSGAAPPPAKFAWAPGHAIVTANSSANEVFNFGIVRCP